MYTDRSKSVVVDISNRNSPKTIQTPMREEAYPVEAANGGWELIASPVNGGANGPKGGMNYYKFSDLTDGKPSDAKPTYTDPSHGEYYHSSATLPGSTEDTKKVRTLLYSDRSYRDYSMKMNASGSVVSSGKSEVKKLCDNVFKAPSRTPEAAREFRNTMNEIENMYRQFSRENRNPSLADQQEFQKKIRQLQIEAEKKFYGPEYVAAVQKQQELDEQYMLANKALKETQEMRNFETQLQPLRKEQREIEQKAYSDPRILEIRKKYDNIGRNSSSQTNREARLQIERERSEVEKEYRKLIEKIDLESGKKEIAKKISEVEKQKQSFVETSEIGKKATRLQAEHEEVSVSIWGLRDGNKLSNPVLSKDGQYVGGLVGSKLEVFKIDENGDCTQVFKSPFRGSKVNFSYPEKGKAPKITFTTEGGASGGFGRGAYIYDIETKETQLISKDGDTAYYPGFTKDGRVMYKSGKNMVLIDPNQQDGSTAKCIKSESVTGNNGNAAGTVQ